MNNNVYCRGVYFDNSKKSLSSKLIGIMSNTKYCNIATFVSAVVGGVATVIGSYFMGVM